MTRVLVTGANGFVGNTLCPMLAKSGLVVRAALRSAQGAAVTVTVPEYVNVGEIGANTDWTAALTGVDAIIHLAARAHVLNDRSDAARQYFETNAQGTRQLAEAAARAGVRRLVFLSSVKVNGEETHGRAFCALDAPRPLDAYGASKLQAEQFLAGTSAATGLQSVVVRSPLVYGPGVRANFLRLLRWVDRERWLPLGSIRNQRSLVSVWNLCDLLKRALEHPAAAGRIWMVSDGRDISTPELVRLLARSMGRRVRLAPVPPGLLHLAGAALGKGGEVRRLCGSLTVDIEPTRAQLDWSPAIAVEEALTRTVRWYESERHMPV